VNRLFGDIVKVTPTSKVVGDMALMMVGNDLTPSDVLDPARDVAFPESVVSLFKGELGFPPDGFPQAISRKVLRLAEDASPPQPYRPGDRLPAVDLQAVREQAERECELSLDDRQLASYLMYPKVMREFCEHTRLHGDTSVLPTPVFFYGPQLQQEMALEIDPGKTLLVALQSITPDGEAAQKVQFELNGQTRMVRVLRPDAGEAARGRPVADPANPWHVAAPMPGGIVSVAVVVGQHVSAGSTLLSLEAMKMETHVAADRDAEVEAVHIAPGDRVQAKDLLILLRPLTS
jgi:pyruvate carboxylase